MGGAVMPGMNPRPTARKAWGLVLAIVVPTHPAENGVWMATSICGGAGMENHGRATRWAAE